MSALDRRSFLRRTAGLGGLAVLGARPSFAQAPMPITVAESEGHGWTVVYIADAENTWAKFGLKAEVSRFTAGRLAMEAVLPSLSRRAIMAIGMEATDDTVWLTQREQIILQHLLLGKSVREIAQELGRSPHTVHDHVKSLHRKLNASSRGELVARALGHVEPPHAHVTTRPATTAAATRTPTHQ